MKVKKCEQGFSYIDVMIAMTIMLIGVLAMTGAVMANLVRSYETDKQVIAKQIALSTIESVFSAKEIKRTDGTSLTGWNSIGNVGNNPVNGTPQGIFMMGFRPVRQEEGADGIFGTPDDGCNAGAGCSGSDGSVNNSAVINGYTRQVEITDISEYPGEPIKKRLVNVIVEYEVNGGVRQEKMSTLVSLYN